MVSFSALLRAFAFSLLLISNFTLADEYLTNEDRQYLQQQSILKVGVLSYPHMPYWGGIEKQPEGINHDYAVNIAQELGLTLEYVPYNSTPDLHTGWKKEEFDLAIGVIETQERSNHFLFSQSLHHDIPMFWFRDKSLSSIDPTHLHWGCIKHTYQCEQLKKRGYPNLVFADSRLQLGDMVKQNIVSAVLTTQLEAYYFFSTYKFNFGHLTYVPDVPVTAVKIAITKSKPQLHALIDKVITADKAGMTSKPLHSSNSQLLRNQANISLWQTQQDNQTIRYTIEENMFPLSYLNEKGEIDGYVHALMERIGAHSPMTFEYVPAKGRNVVQMLKDGLVDVLPARNVAGVDKRDFLLTEAYIKLNFAMVVKKEATFRPKLAILDRTGQIHSYLNLGDTTSIVPVYRTLNTLLAAIDKGDVTHAILNQDLATQLVLSNQIAGLTLDELPPDIVMDIELAMVVRKDTPLLHSFLQAGLATLSEQVLQDLYLAHRNVTMEIGYNKNSVKIYALIGLSLFLALTLITFLMLGKHKNYRVESESDKQTKQAQTQWLNELLNSIPNMIALFDKDEQLVLANQSYRDYLNKCDQTQCGVNKNDCKLRKPRVSKSKPNKFMNMRHPLCGMRGQFFHISKTNINTLDGSQQLSLIVYNDITQLKQSEQKLRASNEQAQKAVQARNDFLAVVSHELRTPIAALMGLIDMAYKRTEDTESQLLLDNAIRSAERLNLQVNDILDASKIEAEQLQLDITKNSMIEELCPTIRNFEVCAHMKELSFIVNWAPTPFIYAHCDAFRINQVLNNLLSNALKFTESGKIEVNIDVQENTLAVEVIDTGCGMTPQQLSSIYQPFVQADNSITRRFGGSGLGMSIVKSLVDLMQGTIHIRSESKLGTCVEVRLPIKAERFSLQNRGCEIEYNTAKEADWLQCWGISVDRDAHHNPILSAFSKSEHTNLYPDQLLQRSLAHCHPTHTNDHGKKLSGHVLLVDDDSINRLLLQKQLQELGLTCVAAIDGLEALKVMEKNYECFDLILTDCHMPNLDGFALTKKIKQDGSFKGPIIACTAEDSRNASEKAQDAQFDAILYKPYSIVDLHETLAEYLPENTDRLGKEQAFQTKTHWIERFAPSTRVEIAMSVVESFSENIRQLTHCDTNVDAIAHRIKGAASALHIDELVELAQQAKQHRTKKETHVYKETLISEMKNVIEQAQEWLPNIHNIA